MTEIEDLKLKIKQIETEYLNDRISTNNFQLISLINSSICEYFFKNSKKIDSMIDPKVMDYFLSLQNYHKELEDRDLNYDRYIMEKSFINNYQAFENYIYALFYALYNTFPLFLRKNNSTSVIEVGFDDLFMTNDLKTSRSIIIENKVKQLIQSNNIIDCINKLKTIFGINYSIENKYLNELYELSKLRNIVIHNNSIINSIFIKELKKRKISTNYKVGDQVLLEKIDHLTKLNKVTDVIVKYLSNTCIQQLNQIKLYSNKI